MNNKNDVGDYMKTLADMQGVAVSTVSDGWVMLFKNSKLKELLDASEASGYALVFVKSGDKNVVN